MLSLASSAAAEPPVPTTTTAVQDDLPNPDLDPRLQEEEAWATRDFERQLQASDGGVYVREPAPGERPKGAWDDIVTAISVSILGVIAGSVWGWLRRRRSERRRKQRRSQRG